MSGSDGCRAFHFTSCRWNMAGLECDIGGNGEQREIWVSQGSLKTLWITAKEGLEG